jgi:hypothetical protein
MKYNTDRNLAGLTGYVAKVLFITCNLLYQTIFVSPNISISFSEIIYKSLLLEDDAVPNCA